MVSEEQGLRGAGGQTPQTLREFRAKYLAKLLQLREELVRKYPDREERINYLIDTIAVKLHNLRRYTFADYLFTIYLAVKEFSEFTELIPPASEIAEILRGSEDG